MPRPPEIRNTRKNPAVKTQPLVALVPVEKHTAFMAACHATGTPAGGVMEQLIDEWMGRQAKPQDGQV